MYVCKMMLNLWFWSRLRVDSMNWDGKIPDCRDQNAILKPVQDNAGEFDCVVIHHETYVKSDFKELSGQKIRSSRTRTPSTPQTSTQSENIGLSTSRTRRRFKQLLKVNSCLRCSAENELNERPGNVYSVNGKHRDFIVNIWARVLFYTRWFEIRWIGVDTLILPDTRYLVTSIRKN